MAVTPEYRARAASREPARRLDAYDGPTAASEARLEKLAPPRTDVEKCALAAGVPFDAIQKYRSCGLALRDVVLSEIDIGIKIIMLFNAIDGERHRVWKDQPASAALPDVHFDPRALAVSRSAPTAQKAVGFRFADRAELLDPVIRVAGGHEAPHNAGKSVTNSTLRRTAVQEGSGGKSADFRRQNGNLRSTKESDDKASQRSEVSFEEMFVAVHNVPKLHFQWLQTNKLRRLTRK